MTDEMTNRLLEMVAEVRIEQRSAAKKIEELLTAQRKSTSELTLLRGEVVKLQGDALGLKGNLTVVLAKLEGLEQEFDAEKQALDGLTQLAKSTWDVVESMRREALATTGEGSEGNVAKLRRPGSD